MTLRWSTDVGHGDWLKRRIRGFARDVGSLVPHGFGAYARVFHPVERGPDRRWSDVAARNHRIAHREMQFHLISCPPGSAPTGYEPLSGMSVGSLPRHELEALAGLLAVHTDTPDSCSFAVWDGYAQLHGSPAVAVLSTLGAAPPELVAGLAPPEARDGHRLALPNREYLLLEGSVADAVAVYDMLGQQSPNLWWPADRAWCVATEIDFGWTYVAGTETAIEAILASTDLEALRATVTDGVTYDSDRINAALDLP